MPLIEANKSIHVLHSFDCAMASGWRGYLEEESEYQWIAMTGFLIFILLGAVAIQGTSNLPGVEFGSSDASHAETRVLDIEYTSDTAFTAKVVTDTGIDLYMQTSSGSVTRIIDSASSTDASEMQFMTTLDNDNVVVASGENTLMVIHDPKNVANGEVLISTIQLDNSTGDFEIADLAERTSGSSTSWLMVTNEGPSMGLRGFGSISEGATSPDTIASSMATSILSTATDNTAGVVWEHVASLSDGLWGASGYLTYATTVGSSPATPTIVPVVAVIEWEPSINAPTIKTMYTGDGGTIHSLVQLSDSTVFAAGTQGSTYIHQDGEMTHFEDGSVAAVADNEDRVWLFGDVGSKTTVRYDQGQAEPLSLARGLTFETEAIGFGTHQIFLHGTDEQGTIQTLTIDTSAPGSIESGRGFLNFMFLGVFTIVMVVMAWTAGERLLSAKFR